jgi:hypothetical protein
MKETNCLTFPSEKPPVTSSNCYETIKNASILIKRFIFLYFGTNVDWTNAFVTTCSVLNSCYHGSEETSQNCQKSLFCVDFFHQNGFESAATSQWIKIESKAFCVSYTLPYDRPGVISSLSQVQNFFVMRGNATPIQTPKTHPASGNPLMNFFDRGSAEKLITFLASFPKRKTVFGTLKG